MNKIIIIENSNPIKKRRKRLILLDILTESDPSFKERQDSNNRFETNNYLDIIEFAKKGYHIVSVGIIGLTNFSTVCQYGFGIKQPKQELYISKINSLKETGTLYPSYCLTILPYRYSTNAGMTVNSIDFTNGEGFSTEEVVTHITDAINAELKYIKSGNIVFDFRDLGDEMIWYTNVLRNLLIDQFFDINCNVYFYSFNNEEFIDTREVESYPLVYFESEKKEFEKRKLDRERIVAKEKLEKEKRLEKKRKENEPKFIAHNNKVSLDRNEIQKLEKLTIEKQLKYILESPRPIYFFYSTLEKIIYNYDLSKYSVLIEGIINRFKINEKKNFRILKIKLLGYLK